MKSKFNVSNVKDARFVGLYHRLVEQSRYFKDKDFNKLIELLEVTLTEMINVEKIIESRGYELPQDSIVLIEKNEKFQKEFKKIKDKMSPGDITKVWV